LPEGRILTREMMDFAAVSNDNQTVLMHAVERFDVQVAEEALPSGVHIKPSSTGKRHGQALEQVLLAAGATE
jgi:hypothetical protein